MRLARLVSLPLALGVLLAAAPLSAQATAGVTGVCNDGSSTTAKSKSGACSGHGGVKTWNGAAPAAAAPAPKAAAPAPKTAAPTPAPKMASNAKPADATGTCGDGSYTSAKSKSGACSNHGGVKDWYAAAAPAAATPTPKAAAPAPAPKMVPPTVTPKAAGNAPATTGVKTAPIAGAPAAATALCNDNTYSESQHRSGTCSNHKGVKQWLKDIPPQ